MKKKSRKKLIKGPPRIFITCCGASLLGPGWESKSSRLRTNGDKSWVTLAPCRHDNAIQVIPLDDTAHHQTKGADCFCEPRIEIVDKGRIIIHKAKDGRK